MTIEKIISGLKFTVQMFLFNPSTGEYHTEPQNDMDKITIDACKGAIKLLEQEPILDKIKAEIGNINLNEVATKYEDRFYGFQQEVIKILDKDKAESEG